MWPNHLAACEHFEQLEHKSAHDLIFFCFQFSMRSRSKFIFEGVFVVD